MAKKAKRGRPKGSGVKQKQKEKNSGFWRGVFAVGMIIVAIVLAFGAFIKAPIPHDLWHGVWWALGAATIILPFLLLYLGSLKFVNEEQRIPLPNLAGTIALLLFLASWLHVTFIHHPVNSSAWVGGHGGQLGKAIGGALVGAMGKFLSSLVFFILTIFALLFTFSVDPQKLLALLEIFKREPKEGEDEDLGELKKKM